MGQSVTISASQGSKYRPFTAASSQMQQAGFKYVHDHRATDIISA
jgi:biopolymer transport protein ExbD